MLEAIYADSQLVVGFFHLVRKATAQRWVRSGLRERYDTAQTPCQRVLASQDVPEENKERLRQEYQGLNPVLLRRRIEKNLAELGRLSG